MGGPRDAREDQAAIRRLADKLLPSLMARLEASALGELEVHQDGWRVRLRKPAESRPHEAVVPASGTAARAKAGGRRDGSRQHVAASADPAPERTEAPRRAVTSPAVGVFHPLSGASVGRPVRAGDVVGHVEVLGVPQEVLAPFDGVLGRLLVESGEVVEYGEPLIRIESAARPGHGEPTAVEIGEAR